jgi:hypothetical protein
MLSTAGEEGRLDAAKWQVTHTCGKYFMKQFSIIVSGQ